jgi:hypothetical protein
VTAEVVNLRQFKKKQARADKARQAEQNRISFGRTKAEKQLTKALNEKAERSHQQGRIEKSEDDK